MYFNALPSSHHVVKRVFWIIESQLYHSFGSVIHEGQNTAFWRSVFEPVRMRAIVLNQFAETVATISWPINLGSLRGIRRDHRLSSGYGRFHWRDEYHGARPVFRLLASDQSPNNICSITLKQSPIKYLLNDAKPVKFSISHSHQHKTRPCVEQNEGLSTRRVRILLLWS